VYTKELAIFRITKNHFKPQKFAVNQTSAVIPCFNSMLLVVA
jgi:hypothetical protein